MNEKELQRVAEIIFEMTSSGKDCDICPCSFVLGDTQGCMREPGEDCLQTIKRNLREELKNV